VDSLYSLFPQQIEVGLSGIWALICLWFDGWTCGADIVVVVRCRLSSARSAGELLKQLLVKRLTFVKRSHRHEDISADELVHDLAVGAEALERYLTVTVVTSQFHLQDIRYITHDCITIRVELRHPEWDTMGGGRVAGVT